MLRSLDELIGYEIQATDGSIGTVKDFLFDDTGWVVRYLVADTGTWLPGRKVLIVPDALGLPEWQSRAFPVDLTRQQVKDSPDLSKDQPVSKQHEVNVHRHFAWNPYWLAYTGYEGPLAAPVADAIPEAAAEVAEDAESAGDPHLRSAKEVKGYHVAAADGEIGHIEDFILDEDGWILRYVVVDTRNWFPGKRVLQSVDWFDSVSWTERTVSVNLDKETIRNSPVFDPERPVNREDETILYDYFGRPHYWKDVARKVGTTGGWW